jgi:abequosyltransferase
MIKLSFCIPTYNRADYLEETLSHIIDQADERIEIVVSDNGGDDRTQEVIESAKERFKNITYFRWDANKGADINYLKSVELASGEFCWFMGSDDLIVPGAVQHVFNYLTDEVDVVLCSQFICDIKMNPIRKHNLMSSDIPNKVFHLNEKEDLINYFNNAQSHSALFGFLSTIIFRRSGWNKVNYDNSYTGTLYSHMFMLYSFLHSRLNLQYIKEPLVNWRGGNDSFGGKGKIMQRFMVDFVGFKKIIDDFFIEEEVSTAFKGAFRRHHPFTNIAYLRLNVREIYDWDSISKIAVNNFDYPKWLFLLLRPSVSKPFLYILFKLNRLKVYLIKKIRKLI